MLDRKLLSYGLNVSLRSLFGIVTIKIITQIFNQKEVGLYYLILSIVQFYNLVFLNPFNSYYSRNIIDYYKANKLTQASFFLVLFYLGCGLLSILISFLTFNYFDLDINIYYFIIFIFLSIIISTVLRNLLQVLNSFDELKKYTLINIISIFSSLIFSLILIFYYEKKIISWLFGIILSESIILLFLSKYIRLPVKSQLRFTKKRSIYFYFFYTNNVNYTVLWIQSYSYRFVIKNQFLIENVAFATIGYSIASLSFSTVETLAGNYYKKNILSNISDFSKSKLTYIWNLTTSRTFFIYIITCFLILSISKPSLYLITDMIYLNSSLKFVYLGIITEFFRVVNNQFILISNYSKQTKKSILPHLIGGLLTCILFYFYKFSTVEGVFYVIILSNIISLIISFFSMKSLIDYNLKIKFGKLILFIIPYILFFIFNVYFFKQNLSINLIILIVILMYTFFVYNKNFKLFQIT